MKIIPFILLLLVSSRANSQSFFFLKTNYRSTEALDSALPALAQQVLPFVKEKHKQKEIDDRVRYAILAGQYNEALDILRSERAEESAGDDMHAQSIGFAFELYARIKQYQQSHFASFGQAFANVFPALYYSIKPVSRVQATFYSYSAKPLPQMTEDVRDIMNYVQKSDTLSLDEAKGLLLAYSQHEVYSKVIPLMEKEVTAADKKDFIISRTKIITRDGSTIPVTVVRDKKEAKKRPAVFVFNIYLDSAWDITAAKRYAASGYVGVIANTRGKGISPQTIEPYEHDANDAYNVIDWISKQKWNNGKVGMTGGSYLGFVQWAAAKHLHPALKTIMPEVAVAIGTDFPVEGNIFMTYMLQWIHLVTNTKATDDAGDNNWQHWSRVSSDWYAKGASFRSLDSLEGRPNAVFQRWLQHPSFDSYWQSKTSYGADFSNINIPVLTTTGYFDGEQIGALYYYKQHYLYNPKANNYLVIGPYTHSGAQRFPSTEVGKYKVDSVAASFNFYELGIQWFNYILKDSAKPALLADKVNYEVMGTNTWKHAPSLQAMSNDTLTYYLTNTVIDNHLKPGNKANADEYIKLEVDLSDRSDSSAYQFRPPQSADISRNNALVYITPPVTDSFDIVGSLTANLQVAINKKDLDVLLELYELMPDGTYFLLGSTLQRASYAKDVSHRELLHPAQKETIPILSAFGTGKRIGKGSRLVIKAGINKSADWQINYGTGKDVSDETIADAGEPLQIKWFSDSYIKIPVWRDK